MEIIVNKHFTLSSPDDKHYLYRTPIWEIEIKSDLLDDPEFESGLQLDNNFTADNSWQSANLRSKFTGTGKVASFLADTQKDFLLNLVFQSPAFRAKYYKSIDEYKRSASWFATVLKDSPGFAMTPHIDNGHIVCQMIVNLLQDNETATEFYQFDKTTPCYKAPLKKNHGVLFVNTPGAVHSIANITQPRWILYGGLTI